MSERDQFIAEVSKKLLGDVIGGALARGETPHIQGCVDIAVKAAAALFDRLSEDGNI
jgi:hypothetical protein